MEKDLQDRFLSLIKSYMSGNPVQDKEEAREVGRSIALSDISYEEIRSLQERALKALEADLAMKEGLGESRSALDPVMELITAYSTAFKEEIAIRKQEQQVKIYAEKLESSNRALQAANQEVKESHAALEEANARLELANQELEEFASVVSHDLKAPLRAIQNLAEWIEEDLEDRLQGESKRNMDLMKRRVIRMKNMIDGVLEYSRAGRSGIVPEEVDCKHLLVDVIDLLIPPVTFKIGIHLPMPVLHTARAPLQQVFTNLVGNAIKHHHSESGCVDVSAADAGEYVAFTVKDDGPGIPADFREKAFERFQVLQSRDEKEGTGIGLALVKKIVVGAGGEIRLEAAEGQGCTFTFLWPREWKNEVAACPNPQ